MDNLNGGGVQRSMLRLADELIGRGHEIDVVCCFLRGDFMSQLPPSVYTHELRKGRRSATRLMALKADPMGLPAMLRTVMIGHQMHFFLRRAPALARYMLERRPTAVLSATPFANIAAVWARDVSRVPARVIATERSALSHILLGSPQPRRYLLPRLLRRVYDRADAVVAVSKALADDVATVTGFPRHRILTIYNPVIGPEVADLKRHPVAHPWLQGSGPPVVLAVGRVSLDQKDYPTLLEAFAILRRERDARLILVGGEFNEETTAHARQVLRDRAQALGIAANFDMPGFDPNPFAWMARASLFVLSSRFEGLPGVVIQALACGCPVVATDCPTGPREILDDGRYGALVPVGDPIAMAAAMKSTLDSPPPRDLLEARGASFSVSSSVDAYEALIRGA